MLVKEGDPALEALLAEEPAAARKREQTAFADAAGPSAASLVLFGAGNLGRRTLAGLRQVGVEPIAFTDNESRLWGRTVDGLAVLPPAEAAGRFGRNSTFVVTIWRGEGTDRMGARVAQLRGLGCGTVVPFSPLFFLYPEIFLPHYALDLPHRVLDQAEDVRRAFALFSDPASRAEYVAQVRWRLLQDFDVLPDPVAHEIYFPDDLFSLGPSEVLVDCGAFDGDTVRRFLARRGGSFGLIEALEPDPGNFAKLRSFRDSLPDAIRKRVRVHGFAAGAAPGKVRFQAVGTEASRVGFGELEVPSVGLDDLMESTRPTFVKMDIEGSELDAIAGCRRILAQDRPALAICCYHLQDHLWRIPLAIAQLAPDYCFFLRPHLLEVWDLVCYAVPEERLEEPWT